MFCFLYFYNANIQFITLIVLLISVLASGIMVMTNPSLSNPSIRFLPRLMFPISSVSFTVLFFILWSLSVLSLSFLLDMYRKLHVQVLQFSLPNIPFNLGDSSTLQQIVTFLLVNIITLMMIYLSMVLVHDKERFVKMIENNAMVNNLFILYFCSCFFFGLYTTYISYKFSHSINKIA